MKLIGMKVVHNKLGKGVIKDQTDGYVSVLFDGEAAPRKFAFPRSFAGMMRAEHAQTQAGLEAAAHEEELKAVAAHQAHMEDLAQRFRQLTAEERAAEKARQLDEAKQKKAQERLAAEALPKAHTSSKKSSKKKAAE